MAGQSKCVYWKSVTYFAVHVESVIMTIRPGYKYIAFIYKVKYIRHIMYSIHLIISKECEQIIYVLIIIG